MYGTIYVVEKTTVYLTPELRRAIKRMAQLRKCREADVIRDALARLVATDPPPPPKLPLFRARGKSIAERVDEVLADGFGRT